MSASPIIHPLGRLEDRARARLRAPAAAALTLAAAAATAVTAALTVTAPLTLTLAAATAAAVAAALTVAAADAVAAEAWALKAAAPYNPCIADLDLQVGAVCVGEGGKGRHRWHELHRGGDLRGVAIRCA